MNQLVNQVESWLYGLGQSEVPSRAIGELVMEKLKELDAVAYVRFASVYR
jgi:transcriptional repressor NrdR